MISVTGLKKHFLDGQRRREVLSGLELEVRAGEYVAVVGESGSGKSTLLNTIGGLDREFEGDIRVEGVSLPGLNDDALSAYRNRRVGFVFQTFHLVARMRCIDNVLLPWYFAGGGRQPAEAARARAQALLEQVGLGHMADRLPAALSGGEKQRVAIARALFNEPALLLCDEPTGNLDRDTGERVLDLFDALRRERPVTLLMVTHEERLAARADRVLRLREGRFVTEPAGAREAV